MEIGRSQILSHAQPSYPNWEQLPKDVWINEIISRLGPRDISCLSLTCRQFNRWVKEEMVGKKLYKRDYPWLARYFETLPHPVKADRPYYPWIARCFKGFMPSEELVAARWLWLYQLRVVNGELWSAQRILKDPFSYEMEGRYFWTAKCAAFPDGRIVVGASCGRSFSDHHHPVYVYGRDDRDPPLVLKGHKSEISCIKVLSNHCVATASFDKTVRIWNIAGSDDPIVLKTNNAVSWITPLTDGRIATRSYSESVICIWSLNDIGNPLILQVPQTQSALTANEITAQAVLEDGRIAVLLRRCTVCIWSLKDAIHPTVIEPLPDARVFYFSVFSKGFLAMGFADHTVHISTLGKDDSAIIVQKHPHPVHLLEVLPDGRFVASYPDCTIRVWSVDGRTQSIVLQTEFKVSYIAPLLDGRILACYNTAPDRTTLVPGTSFYDDDYLCVFTSDGKAAAVPTKFEESVQSIEVIDDGKILIGASGCAAIWAIDPRSVLTVKERKSLDEVDHRIKAIGDFLCDWAVKSIMFAGLLSLARYTLHPRRVEVKWSKVLFASTLFGGALASKKLFIFSKK